jgi:hypothetical protein
VGAKEERRVKIEQRCTFHRDGEWCGRLEADETNHSWANERKLPGTHVWRHDARDAAALSAALEEAKARESRSEEYNRGYDSGYHAGFRAATPKREKCDHKGIGLPWCRTCAPRTIALLKERGIDWPMPKFD